MKNQERKLRILFRGETSNEKNCHNR